jgi:hypothetical protein
MRRTARSRLTYGNVTATLALFVALSGGAYAASTLPARSVGSKQLKKNAVVRSKIKRNAVNGSKVARNSLTGADVRESSLGRVPSAVSANSANAAGSAATATSAGHAGSASALDKVTYKTAAGTAPGTGTTATATAACDAGQHVTGGGVKVADPNVAFVDDTYPDNGNTAWTGRASTGGGTGTPAVPFTVYAICTTVSSVG